jgi:hypothetical protein
MALKYKVLLKLVLILTVLMLSAHYVFTALGDGRYPQYLFIIPLYFLLEGFVLFALVGESEKKKELPSPMKQILIKGIKMISCIIVLIIGILLDRAHVVEFSLTFALFYVIYLIFETREMMKLNIKQL